MEAVKRILAVLLFEAAILLAGTVDAAIIRVDDSWGKGEADEQRSNRDSAMDIAPLDNIMDFTPQIGYLRAGAVPSSKPRVARVAGRQEARIGLAEASSDIPWQGLVVLPDFSAIYVDPEFAATMWSVMACESKGNPLAVGAAGERGLFQLHPIHQRRIAALGFTWDEMFLPAPNVLVAESIWKESGWKPWSCKPIGRSDGTSGDY